MGARPGNRNATTFTIFRGALTVLAVLVTLGIVSTWQGLLQARAVVPMEPTVSPVWVFALIGVCLLQVGLLWWTRIAWNWWEPILVEAGLFLAFAVVAHQVVGSRLTTCNDTPPGPQICTTIQPAIIHGAWLGLFGVIGIALGILWTLSARSWRRLETPSG